MTSALLSLSGRRTPFRAPIGAPLARDQGHSLWRSQPSGQPFYVSCSVRGRRRMSAATAGGGGSHMPPPVPGEHDAAERQKVMSDGERRAAAAAARHRADPDVMEIVDGLLESVPPSASTYVLRLLVHAVDPDEVARENADALSDDFFLAVKSLLTSEQFKKATSCGTPRAASIVSVFDSAWRAAQEVRASRPAGGGAGGQS